jgi:hypothetical protein
MADALAGMMIKQMYCLLDNQLAPVTILPWSSMEFQHQLVSLKNWTVVNSAWCLACVRDETDLRKVEANLHD